jgi:putative acetyltransferase
VNLARVVVIGTSGAGKTTFARRLAASRGILAIELDSLYWGPGWTPRSDFREAVLAAVQQPRWVIDGNFSSVRDLVWRRCTSIVWLDYSFAQVLSQALRRTTRRVFMGERLYGGNRETIRGALFDREAPLWLVVRTHGRRRREFPELFRRSEYGHASITRLGTPEAAETFLAQAGTHAAIDVRPEAPADLRGIREVNREAFARPNEAALVDALRATTPCISLVAASAAAVVGHILFTPVEIVGPGSSARVAGLGPMAVRTAWQRGGIGARLVRAGLEECRRRGYDAVVVLGHPHYYPRFGFAPGSRLGLRCEFEAPDEAFMAQELRVGALGAGGGLVRYSSEFHRSVP